MQLPRVDTKNLLGLADKVVGLGKEILGSVTNRERLTKAGQIQQEKGAERIEAVKSELAADAHETKAAAAGRTQRTAQKSKEAVNS